MLGYAAKTPSSPAHYVRLSPSGHHRGEPPVSPVLQTPAGEKREMAAPAHAYLVTHRVETRVQASAANALFSPVGRRWPEGPDEGVPQALINTASARHPDIIRQHPLYTSPIEP
jgi:hypothetical protein